MTKENARNDKKVPRMTEKGTWNDTALVMLSEVSMFLFCHAERSVAK